MPYAAWRAGAPRPPWEGEWLWVAGRRWGPVVGSHGGFRWRGPMEGSDGGVRWWRAHSGSAGLEAKTSTRRREPPQRSSIFMSSALRISGCGLYLSSILVTSCFDQCLFCWLDDTAARMLRNRWQSSGPYMVNV